MAAAATGDDADRDLKTKETTTTESESGDILTQSNEEMLDLACDGLLATNNKLTAEASAPEAGDHHDRDAKKESSASEDDAAAHKEDSDSLFKEGEMLRLWEELREAERLWGEKFVLGALDRWLERKTTQVPAVVGKKKKKVVRVILPNDYIDYIKKNPGMMREVSDEEMAECPECYHQRYAITKLINTKNRAYQQALIDQYQAFGFIYDEKEVTDDEEEVVGVKN